MTSTDSTVFIVDDDRDVREFLERLVTSKGMRAATFESAQAFLDAYDPASPGCLVLDISMPGMSGLELQEELAKRRMPIPVIILTGKGDVATARAAFRGGIVDFVLKPFRNRELLGSIDEALLKDAEARGWHAHRNRMKERFDRLSPRECQVVDLMVDGKTTKEIAFHLGLSPKTVDVHRSNAMRKLQAGSLAELVRMAIILDPRKAADGIGGIP